MGAVEPVPAAQDGPVPAGQVAAGQVGPVPARQVGAGRVNLLFQTSWSSERQS